MRKWLGGGILALIIVGVAVYFGLGLYIHSMFTTTHPRCESVYMDGRREFTPANFAGVYDYPEIAIDVSGYLMPNYEMVEFPAREDGVQISGWLVTADDSSGRVVIVTHGGGVCKRNTSVLLPAGMLVKNGFDVLLIDLRNHGESAVTTGRLTAGIVEYRDVLGAFDWLRGQGYAAESIGVMGVSMGAATSTNAFGVEPALAALWTDSAFADVPTVINDQLVMNGLPTVFTQAMLLVGQFNGMDYQERAPVEAIAAHNGRPMMITHGTADEWVNVRSAETLYQASSEQAELWLIEGARHVEALFLYPQEYEQRMVAFFEQALVRSA